MAKEDLYRLRQYEKDKTSDPKTITWLLDFSEIKKKEILHFK